MRKNNFGFILFLTIVLLPSQVFALGSLPGNSKKSTEQLTPELQTNLKSETLAEMLKFRQKHGIVEAGFAEDVDNVWPLGAKVDGKGPIFASNVSKVVWYCKFAFGERSFKSLAVKPELNARWYNPSGHLVQDKQFTLAFGNADMARNELVFSDTAIRPEAGAWRVEVRIDNELIFNDRFEIKESPKA